MTALSRLSKLERDYEGRAVPQMMMTTPDGKQTLVDAMDNMIFSAPMGTVFASPDGKLDAWAELWTAAKEPY